EGQRGGKDEAARLGGNHGIDPSSAEMVGHAGNGGAEGFRRGQQRRDVLEDDPRLGEIGDVANVLVQIKLGHGILRTQYRGTPRRETSRRRKIEPCAKAQRWKDEGTGRKRVLAVPLCVRRSGSDQSSSRLES